MIAKWSTASVYVDFYAAVTVLFFLCILVVLHCSIACSVSVCYLSHLYRFVTCLSCYIGSSELIMKNMFVCVCIAYV